MLLSSGCQALALGESPVGLDFGKSFLEVLLRVFPFKGFADFVVYVLKLEYGFFQSLEIGIVVWRKELPLQNREKDLNLVKPTGMYRRMNLYCVGVPLRKAFHRGFSPVRRTIIRNPEHSTRRAVGLLLHDQVHQLAVGLYSRFLLADSEELGSMDIPSGEIGQGPLPLVFKLHKPWLMRHGTGADELSVSGLDTGLLVGTDDVVIRSQRNSLEKSEIEVQDTSGFFRKKRVPREQPAPMRPWLYSVGAEITPNRGYADGHQNPSKHCFSDNVGATQARKGESLSPGELTGESLDFHNALRGKKTAAFRSAVGPQDHPSGGSRTVSSTW